MAEDLFDVATKSAEDGETEQAIVLRLYVHPGAGRPAVVGTRGDALYVRVAPPPIEGRANAAVVDLVSELFGVAKSDVELVGGEHNRAKRVRVRGVEAETARRVLDRAISEAESGGRRPGGRSTRRP